MRSACRVRTRFILNNFSGIGLGSQDPQDPLGYAPGLPWEIKKVIFGSIIVMYTHFVRLATTAER